MTFFSPCARRNPHTAKIGVRAGGKSLIRGCKRWLKGRRSDADAVGKREEEGKGSGYVRRGATAVPDPVGPCSVGSSILAGRWRPVPVGSMVLDELLPWSVQVALAPPKSLSWLQHPCGLAAAVPGEGTRPPRGCDGTEVHAHQCKPIGRCI